MEAILQTLMASWPIYLIGFLTFFGVIIADVLMPSKKFRPKFYLQEFIYTAISIALGIFVCVALELSPAVNKVVAIMMGLFGSTFIRKIRSSRQKLAGDVVDKIEEKIKSK